VIAVFDAHSIIFAEETMRIIDVDTCLLAIPIRQHEFDAPWVWGSFNQIVVSVPTDEGITGYGEAFGYGVPHATAAVIERVLKPMVVGEDPTQIAAIQEKMFRQTHLFGRYGITTFAISAIDIALWDIAGKCADFPLYRLFGGTEVKEVSTYASLGRYPTPEAVERIVGHTIAAGYGAVKLHQLDVESLRATREVAGDGIQIMMDVNCAWSPEDALERAREFSPYNLLWFEEPIWPPEDFESLARLGKIGGIPIGCGENACTVYISFIRCSNPRPLPIFNPALSR
jgi:L-alanine-DL-glutamate epimerase-like enolase superfamily enzyme